MNKIAAIQMCSSDDVDKNLATAADLIAHASHTGAKIIVLPEMFAIMGTDTHNKLTEKETLGHGKIQSFLSAQAKQHHVWIIGGTLPLTCTNPHKVRAACLVYDDQGKLVAHYDKIHLFDVTISATENYKESDTTEPGDQLVVIDSPIGKIGLSVCYDLRFPELYRGLFNKGAEIIVIPAAFTVKTGQAHWEVLAKSRAIENFCYVVGAAQGGTHSSGRKTYGHSFIIEPWGTLLAEKQDDTPGVIYAEIDLDHLRRIRKSIPVDQHQKYFFNY